MSQRDENVGFWQTEASVQDKVKGRAQVRGAVRHRCGKTEGSDGREDEGTGRKAHREKVK